VTEGVVGGLHRPISVLTEKHPPPSQTREALELPGFSGHLIVVADARPRTHSD
jgi:hypothetical protein